MVIAYSLWAWAFLPTPAVVYTMGVLRGILGPNAKIKQIIGKRFRVFLDNDVHMDIKCSIKEQSSGDWFVYRLSSSPLSGENLENVALRHGMRLAKDRFMTWVGFDELHHRMILLTKAISTVM
jgi:hypothetical protein